MNPFDLRGPQYLAFYAGLAVVLIAFARWLRRWFERSQGSARAPLEDPYLIAALRGGEQEAVRVAVVSLVDRGLLNVDGVVITTSKTGKQMKARKRLERELLAQCAEPQMIHTLLEHKSIGDACKEMQAQLQRQHLVPNHDQLWNRLQIFLGIAFVLLVFSIVKITVALMRGRHNIWFLVILTVIALLAAIMVTFPRRTARGDEMLSQLENLFDSLKLRAKTLKRGGGSAEVVLLSAVFGVTALDAQQFAWSKKFFAAQTAAATSSSSSSCGSGSGCGSSSSSCGSSCGGGCGGGCGGCGS